MLPQRLSSNNFKQLSRRKTFTLTRPCANFSLVTAYPTRQAAGPLHRDPPQILSLRPSSRGKRTRIAKSASIGASRACHITKDGINIA